MCAADYPPKKGKSKKKSDPKMDEMVDTFESKFDLNQNLSTALYNAGFTSIKKIASSNNKELAKVKGIGIKTANRILKISTKKSKPKPSSKKGSDDLASWLSGDGDDDSLSAWLGEDVKSSTSSG